MNLKVIACRGLAREIAHAASRSRQQLDITFVDFSEAEGVYALERELEKLPVGKYDAVIMATGLWGLEDGLQNPLSVPLVIPRAHDNVTLLLGSKERYRQLLEEQMGAVYFYHGYLAQCGLLDTINHVSRGVESVCVITSPLGDPMEDIRTGMALAREWDVPYLERAESLGLLERLLDGRWSWEEILTVEAGQRVEPSYHMDILTVKTQAGE